MTTQLSFEQFSHMISEELGIAIEQITPKTTFLDDLGVDSLSLVNFIIKLERGYGIKIEMDYLFRMKSIGEAYEKFTTALNDKNNI